MGTLSQHNNSQHQDLNKGIQHIGTYYNDIQNTDAWLIYSAY
jgi:hypothetical protein